jgi:hypothetical protein
MVHKEFVLAGQSLPHTTVMFYGDSLKMWKDFDLDFGDKRTGCCIITMHCVTLHYSAGRFFY